MPAKGFSVFRCTLVTSTAYCPESPRSPCNANNRTVLAPESSQGNQSVMQMQRWPNSGRQEDDGGGKDAEGEETPTVPEVERAGATDGDGEGRENVRGRRERRRRRGWGRRTATEEADKAATERAGDTDGDGGGGQGSDAGGGIATRLRATESDLMRYDKKSDLM
uniref:Uncharacterized protein n=1 Tax=Oryza rufipogon TaxID=4529 RepID=A0A0E0RDS3_ORYRU